VTDTAPSPQGTVLDYLATIGKLGDDLRKAGYRPDLTEVRDSVRAGCTTVAEWAAWRSGTFTAWNGAA
jgi:hypothetical protein